jgi:cytochrome P450
MRSIMHVQQEKKGWAQSIYDGILQLSGHPYPGIPHLKGNLFYGRLSHLQEENGILNTLIAAKPLVESHPSKMCSFWLGNKRVLLVTKPEDIYYFKVKHKELIAGKIKSIDSLHDANHSVVTEEGINWKKKREAYKHHLSSSQFGSGLEKLGVSYINYIQEHKYFEINLKQLFDDFSLKINANLLMGLPVTMPNEPFSLEDYKRKLASIMLTATTLFNVQEIKRESIDELEKNFKEIIEPFFLLDQNNLIGDIGKINATTKARATPKDVMADFNLLLLAGTETNSFALQTTICLLSTHPEIEKKLFQELGEKLKGITLTLENICQLSYLDKVVKEVFRLYPPAPFILPREIQNTLCINEVTLKKGDTILLSPYLTHRLPDVWDNPEKFDPDRFTKEEKIPRGAYIPFGLGARGCPGERYSMLLIKFLIANIYLNYRIELVKKPSSLSIQNSSAFFFKAPPITRFSPYDEDLKENYCPHLLLR